MRNQIMVLLATTALFVVPASAQGNSCWGEASAIFARMGEMGNHASEQDEPRVGLANLSWALYDMGVISEPTLNALAEFVTTELGLDLDRCLQNAEAVAAAESSAAINASCWGQASKVYARMGMMGKHASEQDEPRLGLARLARALYDMGILADDSLSALGAFVAGEFGLSIEACE